MGRRSESQTVSSMHYFEPALYTCIVKLESVAGKVVSVAVPQGELPYTDFEVQGDEPKQKSTSKKRKEDEPLEEPGSGIPQQKAKGVASCLACTMLESGVWQLLWLFE